jgi:hypothetical protein
MVNTFVTSGDPRCVDNLDKKRLNSQRNEAHIILKALVGGDSDDDTSKPKGYANHPATLMWKGHEEALKVYINLCIKYYRRRGGNCMLEKFKVDKTKVVWPWWFTWDELHLSHKCSLLRKDPKYYSKIFELADPEQVWMDYGYIWPSDLSDRRVTRIQEGRHYKPKDLCRVIGAGAPAQYRWTIKEVKRWKQDKTVNPKTGRKISSTSKTGIYSDITKAYNYYKSTDEI